MAAITSRIDNTAYEFVDNARYFDALIATLRERQRAIANRIDPTAPEFVKGLQRCRPFSFRCREL